MQKVVVLRGTPSSGKSTISKSYRNFEDKIVWLKVDNFKEFFAEDSTSVLKFVNGSAMATLEYLLMKGFSVVMDGVFQNIDSINEAIKVANKLHIPIKVFELETSLNTLKKRDLLREGVKEGKRFPLGDETIEKIYTTLKNNPYPHAIKLNTEENSLEECKEIIENSF